LAALVLARAGYNGCIIQPARLLSRLSPLPLSLLRWPGDVLDRLQDMGVTCVGELLRLPRAGLARRIGPEHLRHLDRLVGRCADPRVCITPEPRFSEGVDLDGDTADRQRLLAALAPILERLECFLRARQRGVTALRLVLKHRGASPTVCMLRCVAAEYRAARFAALLAARVEALTLAEPVSHLTLTAGRLRRFAAGSGGLWQPGERGGMAQAGLPDFLQTLIARLGECAVYGIEPVEGHRPERQWRVLPPAQVLEDSQGSRFGRGVRKVSSQLSSSSLCSSSRERLRPLGLLLQPQALSVDHDETGRVCSLRYAGGALHLVSGPERVESGWWDGADIARDYYIARADHGALLWVFRQRHAPRRWYLHGCFA
jgi:protein ImuB